MYHQKNSVKYFHTILLKTILLLHAYKLVDTRGLALCQDPSIS